MNINNLRGINLNAALNQVAPKLDFVEENSDLLMGDAGDHLVLSDAKKAGFLDEFSKNLSDIIKEESSDIYSRYNAGNGNNGGALALSDLIRALWRTATK